MRGIHVTDDGQCVVRFASVEELLDTLGHPCRLVAESTFESWDPQRRRHIAAMIRDRGHEIFVFRPIHTARRRGAGVKSDENDARIIYQIAVEGRTHIYPLPDPDDSWAEFVSDVNRAYQAVRLEGGKEELASQAMDILGPYRALGPEAQSVLGNGTRYLPTLLAASYFAASHSRSRRVFERLLGLHGSGYPTLLRSEVHHHSFRHARARGVTWRAYRRQLRYAYAAFKAARPGPPPMRSSRAELAAERRSRV